MGTLTGQRSGGWEKGAGPARKGPGAQRRKAPGKGEAADPRIASTELPISRNALTVLSRRYLRRDDQGQPLETPEEMFRRVATNIAAVDEEHAWQGRTDPRATGEAFYRLMTEFRFQPNSPTLMNAGRDLQQLSACFVLPVGDSMEDIFDALKNTAIIHKSGGGTGFAFSRLRPKGSVVRSTSGVASGPVSFMRVFNAATEAVKQGGTRRGANMGILRVDHPDIRDFITCKKDLSEITNFNISVAVTEEFMKQVVAGADYDLIDPHTKEAVARENAREIFDIMVEGAWENGDPGIVFIDRINEADPVTPVIGEVEATNPCGEQPLHPGDSCNLGSINLVRHVRDGQMDWDGLRQTIWDSVHFLDNVIEANHYPLPLIHDISHANRKVGLGVMGWADTLVDLGIPYCSDEAIAFAEELMAFFQKEAHEASRQLAEDRGPFPNWEGSRPQTAGERPRRNSTVTTIAPTGTISIIADCSGGIEPLFAVAFYRNQAGVQMVDVNPRFVEIAKERGFYSEDLMERVAEEGSIQHIDGIPADVKEIFQTSHDIPPAWHVRMQAAFQKYTDNAVSKTVNFSNEATRKEVEEVYLLAYELGCKGVTVYRDGSREGQVLSTGKTQSYQNGNGNGDGLATRESSAESLEAGPEQPLLGIAPRPRPSRTVGSTERVLTGCGNLYVTVNEDEQGPVELFSSLGKSGGCAAAQTQAISRLISLCLRAGVQLDAVTKHLRGIRCHNPALEMGNWILSCPDAIGIALQHYEEYAAERGAINGNGKAKASNGNGANGNDNGHAAEPTSQDQDSGAAGVPSPTVMGGGGPDAPTDMAVGTASPHVSNWMGACPDCGGAVAHESGCVTCHACGFTKCG